MKILYHMPSLATIYAHRPIYYGFMHAFEDLGHDFFTYTADENLEELLEKTNPDIFITSSHFYYQKFLDLKLLKKYRDRGMVMFTKVDFWNSPLSNRLNEAKSLKDDRKTVRLIKEGLLGDIFFHVVTQDDERMEGFEKGTGYKFYTIPLAADKTVIKNEYREKFKADISFIGTNLPEKRLIFKEWVFPLKKKYAVKLYGQDWTLKDRYLGWVQRVGQYYNIPFIRSIQKPKLQLEDEGRIYASSLISINIHEEYQKKYGGECNERTFKIPLAGGFEITDNVACIRKYFKEGEEIVIAENKEDWFEKISYYIKYPEKRDKIIKLGRKRVLENHTYHNRVKQFIEIYNRI